MSLSMCSVLLIVCVCVWLLFQLTDRDPAVLTHVAVGEHAVSDLTAHVTQTANEV